MSTRGLLVRFFGGMAVGVSSVALCVGWVAAERGHVRAGQVRGAGQERGSWASPAEIVWLQRFGAWETRLMRSLNRAARASSDASASRLMGPVDKCSDNLERQVGTPPTTRLQRALNTIKQACAHLETAASSTSAQTAEREGRRGGALLLRADQLLPPGETRSLAVIAGEATQSHVDPTFSRIAGDLAGKEIEVRCWSRGDWTRLLREENAYTMHHIDDDALGFAGISGTRDDLAPEVCERLGRLAYHHWMPTGPSAKLLLAAAVVTLTHEPQHSKGIAVEAQAECYAIQLMPGTALELGATRDDATSLQQAYWQHYDQELPAYRSPQCRDGGAYDLRKADPNFP